MERHLQYTRLKNAGKLPRKKGKPEPYRSALDDFNAAEAGDGYGLVFAGV